MLNKNTLGVKKVRGQEIIYQNPLSCLNNNSLQCILTTMIGFVTWPPFLCHHYYKGGQVTKPITVVRIHCKLLSFKQLRGFW